MTQQNNYHPCTSILIEALRNMKDGDKVLKEWDKQRQIVDKEWQEAKADSERILQEQQNTIAEIELDYNRLLSDFLELQAQNIELSASINVLREALMDISKTNASTHGTTQMMLAHCIKSANEVLAATPAQHTNDDMRIFSKYSLQAHDDKVIDRVAVLVYNYTHDEELESKIEALKGK